MIKKRVLFLICFSLGLGMFGGVVKPIFTANPPDDIYQQFIDALGLENDTRAFVRDYINELKTLRNEKNSDKKWRDISRNIDYSDYLRKIREAVIEFHTEEEIQTIFRNNEQLKTNLLLYTPKPELTRRIYLIGREFGENLVIQINTLIGENIRRLDNDYSGFKGINTSKLRHKSELWSEGNFDGAIQLLITPYYSDIKYTIKRNDQRKKEYIDKTRRKRESDYKHFRRIYYDIKAQLLNKHRLTEKQINSINQNLAKVRKIVSEKKAILDRPIDWKGVLIEVNPNAPEFSASNFLNAEAYTNKLQFYVLLEKEGLKLIKETDFYFSKTEEKFNRDTWKTIHDNSRGNSNGKYIITRGLGNIEILNYTEFKTERDECIYSNARKILLRNPAWESDVALEYNFCDEKPCYGISKNCPPSGPQYRASFDYKTCGCKEVDMVDRINTVLLPQYNTLMSNSSDSGISADKFFANAWLIADVIEYRNPEYFGFFEGEQRKETAKLIRSLSSYYYIENQKITSEGINRIFKTIKRYNFIHPSTIKSYISN